MKSGKCCLKTSRLNQTTFPAIFLIELSIVEVWVEMKALIFWVNFHMAISQAHSAKTATESDATKSKQEKKEIQVPLGLPSHSVMVTW